MLDGVPGGVNFAAPRFSEFGQYLSLAPSPQGSRQPGPAGSLALNGHDDGGHHHQPQQTLLPAAVLEERYHPAAAARDGPRTAGGLPPGFANGGFDALAATPRRLAAVQQAADSLSVGGPYARMHSEAEAATHDASGVVAGGGYAMTRTPPPAFDVTAAQGAQVHPEHCWQPPWVSAGLPAQEQMRASFGGPKPVREALMPTVGTCSCIVVTLAVRLLSTVSSEHEDQGRPFKENVRGLTRRERHIQHIGILLEGGPLSIRSASVCRHKWITRLPAQMPWTWSCWSTCRRT